MGPRSAQATPTRPSRATVRTASWRRRVDAETWRAVTCEVGSWEKGRGLATWDPDKMSLESGSAGACGATILLKQVGQSITLPLEPESTVICWPQTGHAN